MAPGRLPVGRRNAITDVAGVKVGQTTLIQGNDIRTGVTVILPHSGNISRDKVPAGLAVANGFGKFVGATQIFELGEIETLIALTNTLSVPQAADGLIDWTLRQPGNEGVKSVNPVVGETNDGVLNEIRRRVVTRADVLNAIDSADDGDVDEGGVGAGAGTLSFGWKGGIGTSSRVVAVGGTTFTIGVLVQSNYGGDLQVNGEVYGSASDFGSAPDAPSTADGSILIVVATDAPLSDRNLTRLARRAFAGLARTGSAFANGSGDYALAFSTAEAVRRTPNRRAAPYQVTDVPNDLMSPIFIAAADATQEAIYNSMLQAESVHRDASQTSAAVSVAALNLSHLDTALNSRSDRALPPGTPTDTSLRQ